MRISKLQATGLQCVAVLLINFGLAGGAETKSKEEKVSGDDAEFAREAASGGMMEVQLGKLASERASNAQVKEFGQRMQKDHSKANDQLKKLAASKGIKLPTSLEGKQKSTVDKLTKLKGQEFDREYISTMVDDHKEDLEKFEKQADKGKDADLKKFASEHVPILRKHLELAQQTEKKISGKEKGGK
jgi:putative membrane protein